MTSRRDFTKIISVGSFGTLLLGAGSCGVKEKKQPQSVVWPSDKINLAFVGIASRGANNIKNLIDQNIVALCDVDWGERTKSIFEANPYAKKYKDFRKMLEKQKDIDAVVVSTPDHNHGVIAMMAIKMGKHVYCEKPLAHSVFEIREITKAAKEYGGQLTETVLLGTAASLFRNKELIWDGNNMKVTNFEEINSVIKPEFRTGWSM